MVKRYGLIVILLAAAFWRFYNYPTRWVLNQDQARDATIALYTLRSGSLPLLGSPSSAGPFNFGPLYDYTIVLFTLIFPFDSGPWIGFTLLSLLTVYLFYLIGTTLGSQRLGLILALVSAFASEFVYNSTDMLNTVIIAFGVTLSLLMALKLITTNRLIFALLLGLGAGFTLNNHFQSLGISMLLLFTPLFLRLPFPKKIFAYLLIGLGLIFTFLGPLIFDSNNNFVWLKSVIEYYTGGVNKFWAPTSWRRDLFTFWPNLFGSTLVGFPLAGWPLLISSALTPVILLFKRRLPAPVLLLGLYFVSQIFLLRYYPGVRSREYLIAFQPLLVFFFGYALYIISKFSRPLSLLLIGTFLFASIVTNLDYVGRQSQAGLIYSLKSTLDSQITGPVTLYSYPNSNMISLPLFYLYYRANQTSPSGTPVLACINCSPNYPKITCQPLDSNQNYCLYHLPPNQPQIPELYRLSAPLIFSWLYVNYL